MAGKGLHEAIIAGKLEVGAAFVILATGMAYSILPGIFQKGLAIFHVFSYTIHEA